MRGLPTSHCAVLLKKMTLRFLPGDCKVQPIPLGVTLSKAQSSNLERLFCHVSLKRDFGALSFATAFENVTQVGLALLFSLVSFLAGAVAASLVSANRAAVQVAGN